MISIAHKSGKFQTLLTAIEAAKLTDTLADQDGLTIFAPTDQAFKKLPSKIRLALLRPENKEALKAIKQSVFDMVLMDIQMPELDGYETVRQLRKDETDERLPVIALTANAMRTDREACLEAGMDAYVSKPIRLKKLAEIIQDVCFAK